jgi:hypothetical protein
MLIFDFFQYCRYGGKFWFIAYEVVSSSYFIALVAVFAVNSGIGVNRLILLPALIFIPIDCILSIKGGFAGYVLPKMEITESESEFANIISIIFSFPAYVVVILMLSPAR